MKQINLVNMKVDSCMDADDYGHRLTECVKQISDDAETINLVKLKLGNSGPVLETINIVENIQKSLKEMGAKNCIFVPLMEGFIEDITIDKIEVKHVEDNNRSD